MRLKEQTVVRELKKNGYKITPQRRAVIGAIVSSQDRLTPSDIHRKVNRKYPGIGLVTVYRTLDILNELGLVCELHVAGSSSSYTVSTPQHHHHLICSGCGVVFDFTGHYLENLEEMLSKESGFEIEGHLLEFTGRCRDCRKAE